MSSLRTPEQPPAWVQRPGGQPGRPAWSRKARLPLITAATLAGLIVVGLSINLIANGPGSGKPSATDTSSSRPATSTAPTGNSSAEVSSAGDTKTCVYTSTGDAARPVSVPLAKTNPSTVYRAVLRTSRGDIAINLLNSRAPCTVNSFVHLAEAGFWDNSQCHRLSTNRALYMLQCGDPNATANATLNCSSSVVGTGGPGYQFANENLANARYPVGTVAMANTGIPDTNGSQFFLVYKNTTLPPDYTPFATITSGLEILQNVASVGTSCAYAGGGGVPRERVIIDSVTITKG